MNQRIFPIEKLGNGRLSIGPRPKLGDFKNWLNDLKIHNVTRVVSLIDEDEVEKYSLQGQVRAVVDEGIAFTRFAIEDYHTPDAAQFPILIKDLTADLHAGGHVFLHCAGGIGRAGTTASCLLMELDFEPDEAMAKVSAARGETCPETQDQVEFVRNWKR